MSPSTRPASTPSSRRRDDTRIADVLKIVEHAVDLNRIATGPADELGLSPGYEAHSCLDFLLQGLQRFPGVGMPFVDAALKSPVTRNRNGAAVVLGAMDAIAGLRVPATH